MKRIDQFTLRFSKQQPVCDVHIGRGLLEKIPRMLIEKRCAAEYVLLTDARVGGLYGQSLYNKILAGGLQCRMMVVPRGERGKDRRVKETVEDFMLTNGYGRDSAIVALGEREKSLRKILSFGHTIAHALENLSSYTIHHGDAVAMGMVVESELSRRLGFLSDDSQERLIHLLRKLSLPVKVPSRFSAEDVVSISRKDKKARKGRTEYVLMGAIGSPADGRKITLPVNEHVVVAAINGCIAR